MSGWIGTVAFIGSHRAEWQRERRSDGAVRAHASKGKKRHPGYRYCQHRHTHCRIVFGPKILAISSANVSRASFSKATEISADVATEPVSALAQASTLTVTQNPAPSPGAIQTLTPLQPPNVLPSPTMWPGYIIMDYGKSSNGHTQGGYAFNAKEGDIVAISVFSRGTRRQEYLWQPDPQERFR